MWRYSSEPSWSYNAVLGALVCYVLRGGCTHVCVASGIIGQMFSCMAMSGTPCQDTKTMLLAWLDLSVRFVARLLAMAMASWLHWFLYASNTLMSIMINRILGGFASLSVDISTKGND